MRKKCKFIKYKPAFFSPLLSSACVFVTTFWHNHKSACEILQASQTLSRLFSYLHISDVMVNTLHSKFMFLHF